MRLPHLFGAVAAAAVFGATGLAALQQAGARDQELSAYEIVAPESLGVGSVGGAGSEVVPGQANIPEAGAAAGGAPTPVASADGLVDPRWAERTARAAGIPDTALTAYARASVLAPKSCRIGWTTLAGIGWIESRHGTLGDRTLGADGHSQPPILGPALNGKGPVAAIRSTSETVTWHGDTTWDHAVGPMQFIPSTWHTWQVDGDGDAVADPNDIDDAAMATANYLCAAGDLTSGDTWSRAIFSYNHSNDYVLNVYTAAKTYADRTS